jgi:hypothetical protein
MSLSERRATDSDREKNPHCFANPHPLFGVECTVEAQANTMTVVERVLLVVIAYVSNLLTGTGGETSHGQ